MSTQRNRHVLETQLQHALIRVPIHEIKDLIAPKHLPRVAKNARPPLSMSSYCRAKLMPLLCVCLFVACFVLLSVALWLFLKDKRKRKRKPGKVKAKMTRLFNVSSCLPLVTGGTFRALSNSNYQK